MVHESQFPENVRTELLASLRAGQLNHKFLYESPKQTERWLALHHAYSPSRTEPGCEAAYDEAFQTVAEGISPDPTHLVGLGCGGGQKDSRLARLLSKAGATVSYTPIDVSVSMVLTACRAVAQSSSARICPGIVCDLAQVGNFCDLLAPILPGEPCPGAPRKIVTFFGMIPNFEPSTIMPALASLIGDDDLLLFSANLAPGPDYDQGINQVLPLYDNALTREWLIGYLSEIGISQQDGQLQFLIDEDPHHTGLKRITAYFIFQRQRQIVLQSDSIAFAAGSRLRVFFSYRHTCASVARLLSAQNLAVAGSWLAPSRQEGVFLVKRLHA